MTAHAAGAAASARATVTYRLKDWLISRQRYWGTPIPVVYCDKDGMQPVPDADLPVVLPADAPFTGEGGNPLEKVAAFVQATCPKCGGPARRETDTMDTFVDSSWYFYRYLSPRKDDGPFDPAAVRYWFPIDLYVGGIEHAILHLVYSRFWTKVMRDLGLVTFDEPVTRLFPQGMVHKDGEVMSKSKGNTVAPDDVIREYGADTLRLYVLSEAPPEMALEWSEEHIEGSFRLVQRVWRLVDRHAEALGRGAAHGDSPASLAGRGRATCAARSTRRSRRSPTTSTRDPPQHRGGGLPRAGERDLSARGRGRAGRGRPGRPARGPRDARPAHEPVHASRVRGDVAAARARAGPRATRPGRWPTKRLRARTRSSWRCRSTARCAAASRVPREAEEAEVRQARSRSRGWPSISTGKEVVKVVVVPGRLVSVVMR